MLIANMLRFVICRDKLLNVQNNEPDGCENKLTSQNEAQYFLLREHLGHSKDHRVHK